MDPLFVQRLRLQVLVLWRHRSAAFILTILMVPLALLGILSVSAGGHTLETGKRLSVRQRARHPEILQGAHKNLDHSAAQPLPVARELDVHQCVKEMGMIHQCANQHLPNCTANRYYSCLWQAGLESGSYSILVAARHGKFIVPLSDMYIGASLIAYGEWSDEEVKMMSLNLPIDGVVVDVGANIGAMTVPLARKVAKGQLIAYEPQRLVSQLLATNVQLNELKNVDVRRAGSGRPKRDEDGNPLMVQVPELNPFVVLNFGGLSLTAKDQQKVRPSHLDMVRVEPLDSLQLRRLDLLKIDAQGMELEVLRGARKTISKLLPVIYMEYESRSRELYEHVKSLGPYSCYHHAPRLYSDQNFNGESYNMFGPMQSFNIICLTPKHPLLPGWLRNRDMERFELPVIQKAGSPDQEDTGRDERQPTVGQEVEEDDQGEPGANELSG